MKLLMENWRRFVKEAAEEKTGCTTVETWKQMIMAAKDEEAKQSLIKQGVEGGWEVSKFVAGFFPGAASALMAVDSGELVKNIYEFFKGKEYKLDDLNTFPILKKLAVDPELVKTIDDDILNNIDEQYTTYLETLDPNTCVNQIPDINHFIRSYIARMTNQHVTIQNLSGGAK